MNLIPVGIQIYQSSISDDFYKFLLDEYENHLGDYQPLEQNENFWNGGADFKFLKEEHRDYYNKQIGRHVNQYVGNNDLKLSNQWINVQAHDGFLPMHDHYGILSYVIYLKVPKFRANYFYKKKQDIGYVEGAIQFNFGYKNSLFPPQALIHPEEKMILIFPAEIQHYVYPFRDRESKRVSISGNFVKIKDIEVDG
jgi:hypothetical protein